MDQSIDTVRKNRILNVLWVLGVLLAIFVGVKAVSALKEYKYIGNGVYPTNTIVVSGNGEVMVIPDTASLTFSVIEEAKTVADAQAKATKKMNDIITALKGMGIEDKDIKTVGYNSYPKYEYNTASASLCREGYCPPGKQVLTGYEVSQTLSVKIRKTDTAGDVLTKVGTLGASNISGLEFVVDDMDKAKAEARDKAIAEAKEKADVLAKSLGVKLRRIVNFNESGDQPYYYGMGGMESKVMNQADAVAAPMLPTGENKIMSNVSITYEIK